HGTFADRRRNRAGIVPKRIQGATFSEPDVELHCFARLYRNVSFHEWLERAARHADGNDICSCGQVCKRVSTVGLAQRTHHDAGPSVLRLDRCVRDGSVWTGDDSGHRAIDRLAVSLTAPKCDKAEQHDHAKSHPYPPM